MKFTFMQWFLIWLSIILASAYLGASRARRRLSDDPVFKGPLQISYRERMRLNKLARSQQVIVDPEDNRKAELLVPLMLKATSDALTLRQLVPFLVIGGFGTAVGLAKSHVGLLVAVAALAGIIAFLYLQLREAARRTLRTVEINDWNVGGDLAPDR